MIELHTDGSSRRSIEQSGAGVAVVRNNQIIACIAEPLGDQTNNYAELAAIKIGLEFSLMQGWYGPRFQGEIQVYTDSQYCIGVLTKDWKPKENLQLIQETKELMSLFEKLTFTWVKGHNGDPLNELADGLARLATTRKVADEYLEGRKASVG